MHVVAESNTTPGAYGRVSLSDPEEPSLVRMAARGAHAYSGPRHATAYSGPRQATAYSGLRPATAYSGARHADRAGRRSRRRWVLLLAAGWLCQVGLRVWFSRMQTIPLVEPDETAYLVAARVLAGGPGTGFSGSTTLYQGGYPLLITPVFWFIHNPVTGYRAVLIINAAVSACLMPLAYVAGRRLGLDRPAAYGVAAVAALLPAGFFYAEYAMADAIFPVLVLAWLLATHSWLTASSSRGRYAAAVGAALLAGYAYAVHSRGDVIVAGFVAVGALVAWRRLAPRGTVAAAALALAASVSGGWLLDRYLSSALYPHGTRNMSAQARTRLLTVHGTIHVFEMAAGQMWRLVLDSWGLAGVGLIAAAAVIVRRGTRADLRIMGVLGVAVTLIIACVAPAALPSSQSQTWASGRYLDGLIVTFFIVGAVVLLRATARAILLCAAGTAGLAILTGVIVAVYAGSYVRTQGWPWGFDLAEPAVLTQDWHRAGVWMATAVALALLAAWVLTALAGRRWPDADLAGTVRVPVLMRGVGALAIAAVSLVALAQMTSHVSQATEPTRASRTTGFVAASRLKPGDQIAVASNVNYWVWVPQAFEVWWTKLEFFNPGQSLPAGTTVVETAWKAGRSARAGWPQAPAGWRIVASNQATGWVVWRKA
jgi:hypothetical protein